MDNWDLHHKENSFNKLITICLTNYDDLRLKYDENIYSVYGIFIEINKINKYIENNISSRYKEEIRSLVNLIQKIENNCEFDKHALFTININNEYIYIGRKWDTILDDETGLQFKTYVKENLEKLFDIKFEM